MSDHSATSKRSLALIGLRGAGKTVVGHELVARLGGSHVDTDDRIVQAAGRSIADIFEKEGETGFRRRERDVVAQVVRETPSVISLGGGAILDRDNCNAICKVADVVWLTAPPGVLWKRIAADPNTNHSRPSLTAYTGEKEIAELLREREAIYRDAADLIVDTTTGLPRDIARSIIRQLRRVNP